MDIRPFQPDDLPHLIDLTIETFGPFYEDSFRSQVGEVVFSHQHGSWREDYRKQVPALHDPDNGRVVAVADIGGSIVGYVAWKVDTARKHGEIDIVAVSAENRRHRTGTSLCEHALANMEAAGVEVWRSAPVATGSTLRPGPCTRSWGSHPSQGRTTSRRSDSRDAPTSTQSPTSSHDVRANE